MSITKALLAVQAEAPALQRDAINPHFKSKYLSLETLMGEILPILNRHGLVLVQSPTVLSDGRPALRTRLVHAESGEALEDVAPLQAVKEDPQAQGSAITYLRRYALMAMLGLVADADDDGNTATEKKKASGSQKQVIRAPHLVIRAEDKERVAALAVERGLATADVKRIIREVGGAERLAEVPASKAKAVLAALTECPPKEA